MIQNKYLADLFKLLPTPSLLLQNNFPLFTIIEANEPFLKLLDKKADEFIDKSIFDVLLENRNDIEAKNILLQSLKNVIETKQHELLISYRFDILSTDKNLSNIKYWDLKNIPLLNEQQELEFIIQCFTDVTERKETEDQLKLSEFTFRNLLNNVTEMIYIHDEQGLFIEVNETVEKTYGYDRNYFIGKSPEFLAAPGRNDLAAVSNAISMAWSGIPQNIEFWGITKDGIVFPKEVNLTLGNYFNKPVLIAVARDITEKIQAQQSLLASEERFKALVEFSSTGIIVHRNSFILYANPTAFKMIGANDEQEVIGKSFIEFVQPDFQKIVKNRIQTIPEVGTIIPKIEEKYIRFDGSEIIVEIQGISILYEGELAIQSSIIDITKHKKAEIAVEANETKFKTIIETSPDGIVISTLDGSIQYVNNVILEMFGFDTKNDILNKNIFSFLHESSQEKATYLISEMLKGNFRGASEYLMLKRDGSTFYCDINGNILKDSNTVPNGFIYVIRDSTEKKKEQHHLKLLESVITNAKDSILITEAEPFDDPGPRILYVNDAFTKTTGYTAAEVIGKSPRILQGEKSDMKELKRLSESIRKWKPCEISTINYKKDGTEFWQNISVTPVADENGWFTHWVSVQRDITEQKRAEEQLLTTNLKLATILDAIPDILFEVDIEGRIYNYHTHQTELLATTPELFLGKTFAEVIVSDAAAICQMAINEASEKGLSTGKQYALQLPQGERWFEISVSKLQMTVEKTERYIFLTRDITYRKTAEIELMKSKKTLRNVLDNAPIGIWLMGADGRMEFVNKVFCDAVGITEEQFLAVPHYSELYPVELAEACMQSDKEALAQDSVNFSYENLIFNDGKMHQLEIQKNKVYNDNNPNPSLIGLMLDITESEKIKTDLSKTANFLLEIQKITDTGTYEFDIINNKWSSSEILNTIFGIDESYNKTLESWTEIIHPDWQKTMSEYFKTEVLANGSNFNKEYQIVRKNDEKIAWVHGVGKLKFNATGEPILMIGTIRDITVRKESEEKIKISNERYNLVAKATSDAIWDWNLITDEVLRAGDGVEKLFGYEPHEILNDNQFWQKLVHPDDLKRVGASVFKAIADPKEHYWEDEFSILNANGEYVYVYDKGYILRDENGKALRMIGATKNIDVRKRTEIALQESEIRYKTLIELSPEPIIVNCHDKIVYVNPAAVKMFGASSAEEILNMSSIEFIVPEYVDLTLKGVINILRGNTDPELTEVQLYKLDGTIIDVEAQGIAIEYYKEPAIQISMRDVTKRKHAEIEKQIADENIRKLSTAIEQVPVSVVITDLKGNINYVNPKFTEMTGYSSDEVIGKNSKILKSGFTSVDEYKTMWKKLTDGENWNGIFQNKKKNGELFWESALITPIKNELGEIINFMALKENITAKLQLELEIKENNKKLEDYKYALDESAIIAITDNEGVILSVNDNFCNLSKYSREELVGKTHQIINSNYHPTSFFKDLWDTIILGNVWKGEIRNKTKNNDYYWEYTTIIPFLDNKGFPFQFIAIRFDITKRKIAEDTILNILEEKNTILESIGDAFFAVNNDWVITYWNNQAEALLEKTKVEVLGYNLWEVFSNSISTEAFKNYHKALENKQVIHFEDYYAPLKKWYEVSAYPSEKGLAVYFKDISERIQYTTAIEAQNKKLHEIAWTQSHIARAPLSRMMGIVDLLKDTEMSTEEFKDWVEHFVDSGNELDTIIKEITKKSEQIL